MDIRGMKQMFLEIEEMAGSKIGSYLRHEGMNRAELLNILEDDFTVNQVEKLQETLIGYTATHNTELVDMEEEFLSQARQIKYIRTCVSNLSDSLSYQISNLPNLLELVVQQQLQNVLRCYQTFHKHDIVNMANKYKSEVTGKGFADTPENRLKFTEDYLKDYFRKVVATSIATGSYKKYKVAVINRFHERYEEMLAG